MSLLLELPTELILYLLSFLPLPDILRCQRVSQFLHDAVASSLSLQYQIEATAAGLVDNPRSNLSLPQKLNALIDRENAWRLFRANFTSRVPVLHTPSGIYDLTGGIYLLGNGRGYNRRVTTALSFIHLPSKPAFTPWSQLSLNRDIVDIGLSVQEHDLIAIVTYSLNSTHPAIDLDVHLLKLSTNTPHPAATKPALFVTEITPEKGRCIISIEIVGDILALLVAFPSADETIQDELYIFDWKKGKLAMTLHTPHDTYSNLVFLSDDLILLPNRYNESLDIYRICTSYIDSPSPLPPKLVRSLSLPKLAPFREIIRIVCRSEPNPIGRPSPSTSTSTALNNSRPFYSSPQDALVLFNIFVDQIDGGSFSFVVHRSSLLNLLQSTTDPNFTPGLPWAQWGPSMTRWFNMFNIPTRWITTSHGQRYVFILPNGRIFLLDFNPYHVRRFSSSRSPFSRVRLVKHDATFHSEDLYMEKVSGNLPYVECLSVAEFDYDSVLMDEERIIGLREADGAVKELEILHFG